MKAEQKVFGSRLRAQTTGLSVCRHALVIIACLVTASAAAQTASQSHGALAVAPLQNEPPAKIVVDPPLAQALSLGTAVVHYRTKYLRITPVFGFAALSISPRVGHVHVSVDDAPWVWAHATAEPVIVAGLAPGPHKIRVQLMTANHQRLDEAAVKFTVPKAQPAASDATHTARQEHGPVVQPPPDQPRGKVIIDSPLPEPLSRGVIFVRYRTENLDIVPVFGPAALAVSPRIGHVHVTVDDAEWHWDDASRNPVIVQGLEPGSHKIVIELADANHNVIAEGAVEVTVPSTPELRPRKH
ncbi:MAG: DUF6130 family protein [Bryobacteraceae bacterium]